MEDALVSMEVHNHQGWDLEGYTAEICMVDTHGAVFPSPGTGPLKLESSSICPGGGNIIDRYSLQELLEDGESSHEEVTGWEYFAGEETQVVIIKVNGQIYLPCEDR